MQDDLARVRQDLETMRGAAGLGGAPIGPLDVWGMAAVGFAGCALALWIVFAGGLTEGQMSVIGTAISLALVVGNHFLQKYGVKRTPARDRAYGFSWVAALGLLIPLGLFYVWAHFYGGLQGKALHSTSGFMAGGLMLMLAIGDPWRLCYAGIALPLLALGFAMPWIPLTLVLPAWCLAIGACGFCSALIMQWQLRRVRKSLA